MGPVNMKGLSKENVSNQINRKPIEIEFYIFFVLIFWGLREKHILQEQLYFSRSLFSSFLTLYFLLLLASLKYIEL